MPSFERVLAFQEIPQRGGPREGICPPQCLIVRYVSVLQDYVTFTSSQNLDCKMFRI